MYVEFDRGEKYTKDVKGEISENHEAFSDAGWLLDSDDYVVDIDTVPKEVIRRVLIDFNINTQVVWTSRGAHLYFKKYDGFRRGANAVSPLGFNYEIKHSGNTRAVTIKQNGKLRQMENAGVREEVPFIFRKGKSYEVLFGMDDGEGRNNAIYRLRGQLAGHKDWLKIITFVNNNIFSEPLSNEEFLGLTRDIDYKDSDIDEYSVASYAIDEFGFLKYGTRYYYKHDDGWKFEEDILQRKIYQIVGNRRTNYVDEVIKQMKYRAKIIPQETVFNIRLGNGYLRDGKFVDIETTDFTPYRIDVPYYEDTEPVEDVDNYIDHLTKSDPEYRKLLLEVLGHCLVVNPEFKRMLAKFFIFIGEGGNGKGTLLQIIRMILGEQNVTGMSIKELSDERYLASFKGKLANLGDDIQDQAIDDRDMKTLKNLTTSDTIATRELYKQAENMQFTGSLIFTSNHLIKSFEKGKSFKRRVMWLPMFTEVKKKDPLFITKQTTEKALQYWVKLIVEAYMRLYENNKFTRSELVEDFNRSYHEENNPYLLYISDMTADDFVDEPVAEISKACEEWCDDNDVKYSRKMFYNTLREILRIDNTGTSRIDGIVTKVFKKID